MVKLSGPVHGHTWQAPFILARGGTKALESTMFRRNRAGLTGATAFVVAALASFWIARSAAADGNGGNSHFPNVELITQDGKKVRFYDDLIKGKIVAIDLIYTTCHYACPLETARLVQVQKKLGDRVGQDIFFYSISIDPEHDTPEALKAYMAKFHVGPGWTFLTGKNGDFLDNFKHANLAEKKGSVDDRPLNFDRGKYLFGRDCVACHSIGHGDGLGPDLLGVVKIRDRQ